MRQLFHQPNKQLFTPTKFLNSYGIGFHFKKAAFGQVFLFAGTLPGKEKGGVEKKIALAIADHTKGRRGGKLTSEFIQWATSREDYEVNDNDFIEADSRHILGREMVTRSGVRVYAIHNPLAILYILKHKEKAQDEKLCGELAKLEQQCLKKLTTVELSSIETWSIDEEPIMEEPASNWLPTCNLL